MGLLQARARELIGRQVLKTVGVDVSPELAAVLFDTGPDGEEPRETLDTGGQQAGKSTAGAARTWVDIHTRVPQTRPTKEEPYRSWYVMPSYRSPPVELDYLNKWGTMAGIVDHYTRSPGSPCTLSMMGGRVMVETRSGQNPEQIASYPCDRVSIVEAGQQPEAVDTAAQGRVMTRRGFVNKNGTLEDDDAHPRWAWFERQARDWQTHPKGHEQRMHALPSWANRTVFPDGELDAEIQRLKARYDEYTYARRVAALPTGTQNPAYPALQPPDATDKYVRRLPWAVCLRCKGDGIKDGQNCRECDGAGKVLPWSWVDGAGGVDVGLGSSVEHGHISAVVAVQLGSNGEAWVRACRVIKTGDASEILQAKAEFSQQFNVYRWGADPMQQWAAKIHNLTQEEGVIASPMEAVSGSAGSRTGRVVMVRRRLNGHTLYFDLNGEGVIELVKEMREVRYVVNAAGQLVPRRLLDDRTAALEDAIEVLDAAYQGIPLLSGWQTQSDQGDRPAPVTAGKLPEPPRKEPEEAAAPMWFGLQGTRRE